MGAQSMKQRERVCAHSGWMTGTVPKVSLRLKWIQGRTVEKMTAITQGPPGGVVWRPGSTRSREKRGALQSDLQGETLRPVTQTGASRKPRLGGTLGKP